MLGQIRNEDVSPGSLNGKGWCPLAPQDPDHVLEVLVRVTGSFESGRLLVFRDTTFEEERKTIHLLTIWYKL